MLVRGKLHAHGTLVILSPTKDFSVVIIALLFVFVSALLLMFFLSTYDYCCIVKGMNFFGPVGVLSFFFIAGLCLLAAAIYPVVFDLKGNQFWFGFSRKPRRNFKYISDIKYLKVRTILDSSYENGSDQYELVSVMNSESEVKLASYTYLKHVDADGAKLSQLLKVAFTR